MPIVYRLENQEGIGVYRIRGNDSIQEILDKYESHSENHKMPMDDDLLATNFRKLGIKDIWGWEKYCFAFSNKAQLRNWFYNDNDIEKLYSLGIGIAVYKVNTLLLGYTQCAFPIEEKVLTNRKALLSLLEFSVFDEKLYAS
jgi:hypothetical protein